jgi:hypothetical protein
MKLKIRQFIHYRLKVVSKRVHSSNEFDEMYSGGIVYQTDITQVQALTIHQKDRDVTVRVEFEYWYTKRLLCEDPSAGSPTEHSDFYCGGMCSKRDRAKYYICIPTIFSAVSRCKSRGERPILFSL